MAKKKKPREQKKRVKLAQSRRRAKGAGQANANTPLAQAQNVVDQANDDDDPEIQADIARKALKISRDCADAYVLLADLAPGPLSALKLYEEAMAASERVLGPDQFRLLAGNFWTAPETRPYMRARLGLAKCLWDVGRKDPATCHLADMLRLNPADHQGARFLLVNWLLLMQRDDDVATLLQRCKKDLSATIAYARALVAFRQEGDTPAARQLAQQAKKCNQFVLEYLSGDRMIPRELPPVVRPGQLSEAAECATGQMPAWKMTPGSVAWLSAILGREAPSDQPPSRTVARLARIKVQTPWPIFKQRLRRLPAGDDVWQADCRQMPTVVESHGERFQPWLLLIYSLTTGAPVSMDVSERQPAADELWHQLARAMDGPKGKGQRPGKLMLATGTPWQALAADLAEAGFDCQTAEADTMLDTMVEELGELIEGTHWAGLLDEPGMTPELVGDLFAAAAAYYRQAPWRALAYEAAIHIQGARPGGQPAYAILIGNSGIASGLAVYDDLEDLVRFQESGQDEEAEPGRMTVLMFGPEDDRMPADVEAAREHGWELAGPEAWPHATRKEADELPRPLSVAEMETLTACLRAVPAFVARHPYGDETSETLTVPVASGHRKLTLAWLPEE